MNFLIKSLLISFFDTDSYIKIAAFEYMLWLLMKVIGLHAVILAFDFLRLPVLLLKAFFNLIRYKNNTSIIK